MSRFEKTNTVLISIDGVEPVDLDTAKEWCYVTGTDQEQSLDTITTAARSYCEGHTWQQIIPATFEYMRDRFPVGEIELPIGPTISIESIKYIDGNGDEQTLNDSEYDVDIKSHFARIQPLNGWPGTKDIYNAVTITFKAGYDESSERLKLPKRIEQAMKMMIKHWFDNRESVLVSQGNRLDVKEVPMTTKALLDLESKKHPV